MPSGDTSWFRRGWNLELMGGGVAVLLIFMLVWVARQDQQSVQLSPAGSADQEKTSDGEASKILSPFVMTWAPPMSERGVVGGSEKDVRLRLDSREQGYLMVVAQDGNGLRRLHPMDTDESAPIPAGRTTLSLLQEPGIAVFQGVYCPFPFAFGDLRGRAGELKVPQGCAMASLK